MNYYYYFILKVSLFDIEWENHLSMSEGHYITCASYNKLPLQSFNVTVYLWATWVTSHYAMHWHLQKKFENRDWNVFSLVKMVKWLERSLNNLLSHCQTLFWDRCKHLYCNLFGKLFLENIKIYIWPFVLLWRNSSPNNKNTIISVVSYSPWKVKGDQSLSCS